MRACEHASVTHYRYKNMSWDKIYKGDKHIWGDKPSELAVVAVAYLQKHRLCDKNLSILDIGCGYGRDIAYFSKNLKCTILGIDSSKEAINMANSVCPKASNIKLLRCEFSEIHNCKYDVIFIANLYHLLKPDERKKLRDTIGKSLKSDGLLFLSTLSVKDPQGYGKGAAIPNEINSFKNRTYVHFYTRDELSKEFNFLRISELFEHEYYEPHSTGETHHHISWILVGKCDVSFSKS